MRKKYTPPPGTFRCLCCGKRLPDYRREPGDPPEWNRCCLCALAGRTRTTEHTNPLGTAEVKAGPQAGEGTR